MQFDHHRFSKKKKRGKRKSSATFLCWEIPSPPGVSFFLIELGLQLAHWSPSKAQQQQQRERRKKVWSWIEILYVLNFAWPPRISRIFLSRVASTSSESRKSFKEVFPPLLFKSRIIRPWFNRLDNTPLGGGGLMVSTLIQFWNSPEEVLRCIFSRTARD